MPKKPNIALHVVVALVTLAVAGYGAKAGVDYLSDQETGHHRR